MARSLPRVDEEVDRETCPSRERLHQIELSGEPQKVLVAQSGLLERQDDDRLSLSERDSAPVFVSDPLREQLEADQGGDTVEMRRVQQRELVGTVGSAGGGEPLLVGDPAAEARVDGLERFSRDEDLDRADLRPRYPQRLSSVDPPTSRWSLVFAGTAARTSRTSSSNCISPDLIQAPLLASCLDVVRTAQRDAHPEGYGPLALPTLDHVEEQQTVFSWLAPTADREPRHLSQQPVVEELRLHRYRCRPRSETPTNHSARSCW